MPTGGEADILFYYAAIAVAAGLVECFFGYRIFRFILGVAGFVAAAVFFGSLGYELSGGSEPVSIIAGLAGGVLGACLFYYLYIIGVFFLGAILGFTIAMYVFSLINVEVIPAVLYGAAIISGALAAVFQKPMLIIATAFGGSFAAVTGGAYLIYRNFYPLDPGFLGNLGEDQLYRMAMIWFALGVFGLVVQLMTLPRKNGPAASSGGYEPEPSEPDEDDDPSENKAHADDWPGRA
ncbi:MAG TPA: TMEM198/TM7SF3 family protein [Thermodesulfobacteriota bacterium]|nr:TMEM198/TM7SF3 family protein [Thermodesulfobacteriota bacterium]